VVSAGAYWDQWSQVFNIEGDEQQIATLSWGSADELLVGGSTLTLWHLPDAATPFSTWTQKLANPVRFALFSPDASLIASSGYYDRLVKVWRRRAFGSDDTRFDISYLRHPSTVTDIHWRKPWHAEQNLEDLLYTFCSDNKIRIWAAADNHSSILQQWGEIDMNISIQPRRRSSVPRTERRYGFVIDSRDFSAAAERAVQGSDEATRKNHPLEHLIEIANRSPELCVVLDGQGRMSAWGLENAGYKNQASANVFNIAHVEGLNISFGQQSNSDEDYARFCVFTGITPDASLTLLVHYYDGRINWFNAQITELFDSSPTMQHRVHFKATWSGHDAPVKKIIRSLSGTTIMSRTDDNHAVVWKQTISKTGPRLTRQSSLISDEHIHRSCVLDNGKLLVNLHHDAISVWDTQKFSAKRLKMCHFSVSSKPLCVLQIPTPNARQGEIYVATICADMKGLVWKLTLPVDMVSGAEPVDGYDLGLEEFCSFAVDLPEPLSYVLPVDPAGSLSATTDFLDIFATDIALAYSVSGTLRMMTARIDRKRGRIEWLMTSTVETGIPHISLASGSSIRKAAVVDQPRNRLTIWDTTGSQLEYDQLFSKADIIQDLDWTSTPDNQSILAVGFPHRVILLSQLRYDYLDSKPAWTAVHEFRLRDITTHTIGDSCWLGSANLAVGAGNQIFVYDRDIEISDQFVSEFRLTRRQSATLDLFRVVRRLNGPLPVFHPQFLGQCILTGKTALVHKILTTLLQRLKFEGDEVDSFLNLPPEIFFEEAGFMSGSESKEMQSSFADFSIDEEPQVVDEEVAASLTENLVKFTLPQISHHEQFYLADIIECVAAVEKHRRSMDENAARYYLFFRQHMLRRGPTVEPRSSVSWREIVWAFHSGSQDILVDLVSRSFQGKMLWDHARESGMFMWITDNTALRSQLEVIARNEYTKTDEKSPVDCSLYYLALGKKAVLQGLWRMASWNREQASTVRLLSNNFNEARWKTAAQKNAYALLGRHRFEYAAAFFLLAGALQDAVNVCVHQLDDLQLGVAIARVYEGDDGPILHDLIEDRILPHAAETGNRWMATWAFWMLKKRDKAVRALISPIHTLFDDSPSSPGSPEHNIPLQAKSYLSNDPALVVLYKQLREKTISTLRGATMINPREEWDFIVRNARLYSRMGCDLLAVDLVRNWEFLRAPPPPIRRPSLNSAKARDPRQLLRRRSSLVVDDMPRLSSPRSMRGPPSPDIKEDAFAKATAGAKKPPPTVFEEPDASSLLDNFGF
jgi:RAVE protein 1 C terminal